MNDTRPTAVLSVHELQAVKLLEVEHGNITADEVKTTDGLAWILATTQTGRQWLIGSDGQLFSAAEVRSIHGEFVAGTG